MSNDFIKLGEIAEFRNGLNFNKESHGSGCLLLGVSDFKDRFIPDYASLSEINPDGIAKNEDYLKKGDIVFVRSNGNKALVGRSLYVNDDVKLLFSGFCIRARIVSNIINPLFFAYYTNTKTFRDAIATHGGTNINNLNQSILSDVDILLFSEIQQTKIISVLSAIDQKIEINNRINAELEAMAKTLYDYWFVQFDFPDENGKPYKSSGGKMVYSKELKREIPAGWEIQPLTTWIANDKSGDWGQESLQGNFTEKVTCIRGADINGLNGKAQLTPPVRYILSKNKQKLLVNHDLIIEISGGSPSQSTGRLAYITNETLQRFDSSIICSNFCKAISLKNQDAFFTFVYLWNRLYNIGTFFGWEGKTSGIKNLLFDAFTNSHKVEMPPNDLHRTFYKILQPMEAKKQKILLENQQLAALRDWLLPMLMNGQVRVESVEDA